MFNDNIYLQIDYSNEKESFTAAALYVIEVEIHMCQYSFCGTFLRFQ